MTSFLPHSNYFQPNLPSPIQKIELPVEIQVYCKRDDLIHPHISGNKWRKLSSQNSLLRDHSGLLTFGGAFSNHIVATAAFAHFHGLDAVGFIRTDTIDQNNPSLQLAQTYGMQLVPISRTNYTKKSDSTFLTNLQNQYPHFLIIPEGGSNRLSPDGFSEFWPEIRNQISINFDYISCAFGTGGTVAGLSKKMPQNTRVLLFPALKNLQDNTIHETIESIGVSAPKNMKIFHDYTFGGYAKLTQELLEFMNNFYIQYNILLDPIYTGKMVFGILDLIKHKKLRAKNILLYHSGGIQGWAGVFYRFPQYKVKYPILYEAFLQYFEYKNE